ncbi:MAG TPA: DNA recombination protein RmuC [Fibrobacteria bacterium]|nr:DNA recombination protein RmuC [Fibrobacteria bacterium]
MSVAFAVLLLSLCVLVCAYLATRTRDLERRQEEERRKASNLESALARAEAERNGAVGELERYRQDEEQRIVRVRAEIENLSNRIFEEKTGKFKEIGTSAIAELVAPVRENLDKLQKALAESETKDAVREQSLREALERVGRINARLGDQADGLAKALKGDNKAVGDFGEEILERLLEYSGLKRGANFVVQGEDLGLRSEAGRRLMPDVVIFLPENRCLVVDSKMSLKSWADAQTDDEVVRTAALDGFRRSTRAHVDDLAGKPYTEAIQARGMVSVDFKFLFIPVESAFHAALQLDRGLYQYAFDRKIILVSPTTLLAVLATVSHTWEQFEIGRNASEIRDRASLLLDKLLDFMGSMEKVGDQLEKARGAFDEARNRLSEGRGNLVGQARKLRSLGVKSEKALPRALEAESRDEEED